MPAFPNNNAVPGFMWPGYANPGKPVAGASVPTTPVGAFFILGNASLQWLTGPVTTRWGTGQPQLQWATGPVSAG